MRALLGVLILMGGWMTAGARPVCKPDFVEETVRLLASDRMEGRGPGSDGLHLSLRTVAGQFHELGLEPAHPEQSTPDDPLAGYLQPFETSTFPATANVIGIQRGRSDSSARPFVILGAHADHLGRDPELTGDQIYNGADDNASGVAALLGIARALAGHPADRSILFIVFSGEEAGLLGSKHYTDHPVVPHDQVLAMINLDSIGRLRNDQVIVFGTKTAREFPAILDGLNSAFGFDLALRGEGAGASDHASFFARNIPVLHFFTGPHEDYSQVSDEAEKINYAGLQRVSNYVSELVRYLSYRVRPLTFVSTGAEQAEKMAKMAEGPPRRVSLGFMPDFTADSGGVKVGPVSAGGAAANAGIQTGDVIIAVDEDAVDTLVDYTAVLRQHVPGDAITVTLRRGDQTLTLSATLQERR